ncbi:MAG: hypothetical protein IMW92_14300 [Bacillales bacterium]|nr:hypothetical protein [Bacillales bacterium]
MALNDFTIISFLIIFLVFGGYTWHVQEKSDTNDMLTAIFKSFFGGVIGLITFVFFSLPLFLLLIFVSHFSPDLIHANNLFDMFGVALLTSAGSSIGELTIEKVPSKLASSFRHNVIVENLLLIIIKSIERILFLYILSLFLLGVIWNLLAMIVVSLIDAIIGIALDQVGNKFFKL